MVRPEKRDDLIGGSSVRVSAGAPGSRLQTEGEIRPCETECRKPLKESLANQRAATHSKVKAVGSSYFQPKGAWEGRAAHITANPGPLPGPQAVARWERESGTGETPTRQSSWTKIVSLKASRLLLPHSNQNRAGLRMVLTVPSDEIATEPVE